MELSNDFLIDAPFDVVWDALLDLERVAPCVPGAEITERVDERSARGRFRVKLGPVSANYRGTIAIAQADRDRGEVVLHGNASEVAAGGTATVVIRNDVATENGATRVSLATELKVTGRAAQFGGRASLMQGIADRLVGEFAAALQAEIQGSAPDARPAADGEPPAPAAPGASEVLELEASRSEPLDMGRLVRDILGKRVGLVAVTCLVVGLLLGIIGGRLSAGASW